MVKEAKVGLIAPGSVKATCAVCNRHFKTLKQLCLSCEKRLRAMGADDNGDLDRQIAAIIREPKRRRRNQMISKLSSESSSG